MMPMAFCAAPITYDEGVVRPNVFAEYRVKGEDGKEKTDRVTTKTDTPDRSVLQVKTMRRVALRIVPFLMLCYFVSFLDRVNVGFAALQMVKDLHMSPSVFGFGSGIFFVSYFLCEVPSNLILQKVGARLWIARIMITWGVLAAGMALVTGPRSFYVMRLLLGAAEAGFFPGMVLYLTYWFPKSYRARLVAMFMVAIPFANIVGAPLSRRTAQLLDRASPF